MVTIERLRRQIVEAQTRGKDTSALEKQLREARLEEATKAEIAELRKVADQRLEWQKEADKVKAKIEAQNEVIDRFLKLRDMVVAPLKEAIDLAMAEGLIKLQDGCYENFHDAYFFGSIVGRIPKGYLSQDGCICPMLEMVGGMTESYDKAAEALFYLKAAYGLLANLRKGEMSISPRGMGDDIGYDLEEDEGQAKSCIVCQHPQREAIDQAIKDGKSLRALEDEFDVSRSSLSRHKSRCLNLGAIRITDAA